MKRLLITAALALPLLSGCSNTNPVGVQRTDNPNFTVDVVGRDADGYTVKRFEDGGYSHYYVTPGPAQVSSQTVHRSGKNTYIVPDEIQTAR